MLCWQTDRIFYMVDILFYESKTENGFVLLLQPLAGWWPANLLQIFIFHCIFFFSIPSSSAFRCGLWHDGGVHLYWDLLQCGHLHCLLLLFHVHDKAAAMDLLQQPLEHTGLQRSGRRQQTAQHQPRQRDHKLSSRVVRGRQPHQEDQPQWGVLEVSHMRDISFVNEERTKDQRCAGFFSVTKSKMEENGQERRFW